MIALSSAVKKSNPRAYVLNPGNFLWRKLKFIITQKAAENLKDVKKQLSFCKSVLILKKIGELRMK